MSIELHIEHRRRELKRLEPELYAYITHVEVAKALDSAGDMASGIDHQSANRLWRVASVHREQAARARGERL